MLFGGKGESGSDRLAKSQATHAAVHRAGAGLFQGGGVRKASDATTGTGGVPSVFLPTAGQERRKAAGSTREPSILPKSAAQVRREVAAEAEAREEAAAVLIRAAAAQAKREADARTAEAARKALEAEQARKAADDRRALEVRKAAFRTLCQRTVEIKAVLPSDLSSNARKVFALLVTRYTDAGNKPVKLTASDAAKAFDLREATARAAIDDLRGRGLVVDVVDGFGVTRLMPAAHAVAAVIEGRAS